MRSFETTTIAGTVASANTSQQVAERNARRDLLVLQNPTGQTGQLFANFGALADSTCLNLAPGQLLQLDQSGSVPGEAVHIAAADAGHAFVLLVGQRAGIE